MPHVTVEYSANIHETDSFQALFTRFHDCLVKSLPADIHACKSRAIRCEDFLVGDGKTGGFVHVGIKIMSGRTQEAVHKTGERLLEIMKTHFASSARDMQLHLTLEINDLNKNYFKQTS